MTINTQELYQTEIGFLRVPYSIPFDGGELVLLPEYEDHAAQVAADTHRDGFVYPGEQQQYNLRPNEWVVPGQPLPEGAEPTPNTRRPAPLFQLPASHRLVLSHPLRSDNPRLGDAGFILHAVGFVYNVRLQFSD